MDIKNLLKVINELTAGWYFPSSLYVPFQASICLKKTYVGDGTLPISCTILLYILRGNPKVAPQKIVKFDFFFQVYCRIEVLKRNYTHNITTLPISEI